MLHVLLSLPHLRLLGRKCAAVSSTPAAVIAAAISVTLRSFSESSRSVLRYPATTSAVRYDRICDRSSGRRSGAAEIVYPPPMPMAAPFVCLGSRAAPMNCRPDGCDSAGVDRSAVPSRRSRPAATEVEAVEGAEAPKEEDLPNLAAAVLF